MTAVWTHRLPRLRGRLRSFFPPIVGIFWCARLGLGDQCACCAAAAVVVPSGSMGHATPLLRYGRPPLHTCVLASLMRSLVLRLSVYGRLPLRPVGRRWPERPKGFGPAVWPVAGVAREPFGALASFYC